MVSWLGLGVKLGLDPQNLGSVRGRAVNHTEDRFRGESISRVESACVAIFMGESEAWVWTGLEDPVKVGLGVSLRPELEARLSWCTRPNPWLYHQPTKQWPSGPVIHKVRPTLGPKGPFTQGVRGQYKRDRNLLPSGTQAERECRHGKESTPLMEATLSHVPQTFPVPWEGGLLEQA